jgi:hypothetical protein
VRPSSNVSKPREVSLGLKEVELRTASVLGMFGVSAVVGAGVQVRGGGRR